MAANTAQMSTQKVSTVANVDVVSLQVSLPQMLDLALGTPEVKRKRSRKVVRVADKTTDSC